MSCAPILDGALGLDVERTAAASVVTRTLKLHVMLALTPAPIVWYAVHQPALRGWTRATASLVASLVVLHALGWRRWGRLTRRLGVVDLSRAIGGMRRALSAPRRARLYATFATGFLVFAVMYGLSRAAATPQGLGATELGGFAMLDGMGLPADRITLALTIWAAARLAAPLLLALGAFVVLSTDRGARETFSSTSGSHAPLPPR